MTSERRCRPSRCRAKPFSSQVRFDSSACGEPIRRSVSGLPSTTTASCPPRSPTPARTRIGCFADSRSCTTTESPRLMVVGALNAMFAHGSPRMIRSIAANGPGHRRGIRRGRGRVRRWTGRARWRRRRARWRGRWLLLEDGLNRRVRLDRKLAGRPVYAGAGVTPSKVERSSAAAVSTTVVPAAKVAEQVGRHRIPCGLLVTLPSPAIATAKVGSGGPPAAVGIATTKSTSAEATIPPPNVRESWSCTRTSPGTVEDAGPGRTGRIGCPLRPLCQIAPGFPLPSPS